MNQIGMNNDIVKTILGADLTHLSTSGFLGCAQSLIRFASTDLVYFTNSFPPSSSIFQGVYFTQFTYQQNNVTLFPAVADTGYGYKIYNNYVNNTIFDDI